MKVIGRLLHWSERIKLKPKQQDVDVLNELNNRTSECSREEADKALQELLQRIKDMENMITGGHHESNR